jgi:hypothetical protein
MQYPANATRPSNSEWAGPISAPGRSRRTAYDDLSSRVATFKSIAVPGLCPYPLLLNGILCGSAIRMFDPVHVEPRLWCSSSCLAELRQAAFNGQWARQCFVAPAPRSVPGKQVSSRRVTPGLRCLRRGGSRCRPG